MTRHLPVVHVEQRNGAAHDDFRLNPSGIYFDSTFRHRQHIPLKKWLEHLTLMFFVGVIISISLAGAGWFVWTLATFVRQLLRGF